MTFDYNFKKELLHEALGLSKDELNKISINIANKINTGKYNLNRKEILIFITGSILDICEIVPDEIINIISIYFGNFGFLQNQSFSKMVYYFDENCDNQLLNMIFGSLIYLKFRIISKIQMKNKQNIEKMH